MNRWQYLTFRITLIIPVILMPNAHAGDYTLVPDEFIYCTTCHGVELRGNRLVDAPRLAGMEGWYAENQIRAFQKGWRGTHEQDFTGMEMRAQVIFLNDEQIKDAIAFVTSVPIRTNRISPPTVTGDIEKGKALYATCAACHGRHGEGNQANRAPALVGRSDWYLVRQLQKFRIGVRGYASADTLGKRMRAASALLKDADAIESVVAYINTL
uniref:Cytochrome c553 n=1 Tax=Candidatus Kentrum sp. TUN TaxID=2126343 RepID=A0A450ZTF6_9GAMM|nr:MAG: Cytochrome c553 [Candidatus Kentron sp. TUN]VFK62563.1 MAG: Cytochrome c553 [Candidatus Kentron sp. TUN]